MTNGRSPAPAVFDDALFDADVEQASEAGANAARAARKRFEGGGVPRDELRPGRLLAALDDLVIVPDRDVRDLVGDLAHIIDRGNEYSRVVAEHEALHGLHVQLGGGEGR